MRALAGSGGWGAGRCKVVRGETVMREISRVKHCAGTFPHFPASLPLPYSGCAEQLAFAYRWGEDDCWFKDCGRGDGIHRLGVC